MVTAATKPSRAGRHPGREDDHRSGAQPGEHVGQEEQTAQDAPALGASGPLGRPAGLEDLDALELVGGRGAQAAPEDG